MLVRASIFVFLVALAGLACRLSPVTRAGTSCGVIMDLPASLPGYVGRIGTPDALEKELLPDDTEFAKAVYYSTAPDTAGRDVMHCSIVLSGAERRSIHRPEVCLVGQGWRLLDSSIVAVDMGGGRELSVKDLYIEKMVTLATGERRTVRAHYVYWFVGADVATPYHVERIWLTLWDNLTRNVNHRWAYPSVMALVTENFTSAEIGERVRNDPETLEALLRLIRQLAPRFQKEFMEVAAH